MTHEQKPESAEFRTREASAWQPISTAPKDGSYIDLWVLGLEEEFRFENAHYGVEHHDCGEYGRHCDSCPAPGKRWIDAFGMEIAGTVTHWRAIPASPEAEAEQRRKDAEGAEAVYQIQHPDGGWDEYTKQYWESAKYPPEEMRVLYTRSANVAALEARVKELEGEVRSIRERVKEAASSVMGIKTAAMGGDNLAILLCTYFEDLIGETDPNGWLQEAPEACDEIQSVIVAHMVAAIREGGEHE